MNVHQKISILMARCGLNQQGLADLVNVSQRSVSDWCKNAVPRRSAIKKLSEVFGVDPSVLLDDKKTLPEWDPADKVKLQMTPEFVNYLKKVRHETDSTVAEHPDVVHGQSNDVDILRSIDRSLKNIAEALQKITK